LVRWGFALSLRTKDLVLGAASGLAASYAMNAATSAYLAHQSELSVRRQDELAPGGAPALFVRRAAGVAGRELSVEESEGYALVLHRTLTSAFGAASAALVGPRRSPMRAALEATSAAFVLVDEGLPTLRIVPAPREWPLESHVRGVVGYAVLGLGIGALLTVADRLIGLDER
jgi:hypothetical protein